MCAVILNVDDNEQARYARSRILRSGGFDVLECGTGALALTLAAESQPDIILLDINLPDISGVEVCRCLKGAQRTRLIPIVHVSSSAMSADYAAGLDAGADACLTEPVDPRVLVATIQMLLRGRQVDLRGARAVDIVEGVPLAFVAFDDQLRVTYANAEAERVLGIRIEDVSAGRIPSWTRMRAETRHTRTMSVRCATAASWNSRTIISGGIAGSK